jgi:plasmid stabilization system protein ParE
VRNIQLSPLAWRGLDEILLYTYKQWGREQALTYIALVDSRLQELRENPHLGAAHVDIPTRYKASFVGKHVIVYYATEEVLFVVAILHQSMNVRARF